MNAPKQMKIQRGEVIFLPPEGCLWDMRQAAKQAARDGRPMQRFLVTYENFYYPQMLDQLLADEKELHTLALALGAKIVGKEGDSFRCAALWDTENGEGFLLRRESAELLCAFIPSITAEAAHAEHALSMKLATLANETPSTPVILEHNIKAGRHDLKELLHTLSEQMEI